MSRYYFYSENRAKDVAINDRCDVWLLHRTNEGDKKMTDLEMEKEFDQSLREHFEGKNHSELFEWKEDEYLECYNEAGVLISIEEQALECHSDFTELDLQPLWAD